MATAKSKTSDGEKILSELLGAVKKAQDGAIWGNLDVKVKHSGKEIILPADPTDMSYDSAIAHLELVKAEEEQEFDVQELVAGAPWDSLVAVYRALQKIYGVVVAQSQQTFFGEIKPDFISVKTGTKPTDVVMVPHGQMKLPNVADPITVKIHPRGTFIIGTVKKRDRARIVEIAETARRIIREESVYKSKAIKLMVDEEGNLVLTQQPEFLDLEGVREDDIIHTREVENLIRVNVFSPLKNTAACRKHRIPLKRGILMEGPYGTGKSLTARVTARVANDNDWTFIMLNRSKGLKSALELARMYQPCVIFAEDVDRNADRTDESVNDLVNVLDGVDTKTNEIMVVLTTNHIELIDKSLLRPGRFDAVISLSNPDADASQRLVRKYTGELLAGDADLTKVGEVLDGISPAAIREVVERAKLAMLSEDRSSLSPDDLYTAGYGMQRHLKLLTDPVAPKGPKELLWQGMLGLVKEAGGIAGDTEEAMLYLRKIVEKSDGIANAVNGVTTLAKGAAASSKAADDKAGLILKKF